MPNLSLYRSFDGAFHSHNNQAAVAGIFRTTNGSWVFGYTLPLLFSSAIEVELMALLLGLQLSLSYNYSPLLIETDSKVLLFML